MFLPMFLEKGINSQFFNETPADVVSEDPVPAGAMASRGQGLSSVPSHSFLVSLSELQDAIGHM
jgi:hypothetical protein